MIHEKLDWSEHSMKTTNRNGTEITRDRGVSDCDLEYRSMWFLSSIVGSQ